jgi:formylglycine-generating enzyme required for sulfatase activity
MCLAALALLVAILRIVIYIVPDAGTVKFPGPDPKVTLTPAPPPAEPPASKQPAPSKRDAPGESKRQPSPSQVQSPKRAKPKGAWKNSIGIWLVRIEPDRFWMGSTGDADPEEQPQHQVWINRPFFLGIYEVTEGQYRKVMEMNPSESHRHSWDDLPKTFVSWLDAVKFCNRLSKLEQRTPCYDIKDYFGHEVETVADG